MSQQIWLVLLFFFVAGSVFVTYLIITRRGQRRRELMERLAADADSDSDGGLVFGELTKSLGDTPMSSARREALERDLREAGFYRSTALIEYTAVRWVLVLLPLITAGVLALLVDRQYMTAVLIGGGVFAVLGFSLPRVYINMLGRNRVRQIEMGLPVAIDLLSLGLSGGQSVHAALFRVAHELKFSFPVLSQELMIVRRQAEISNLELALRQLADRIQVPEVRNLSLILSQSERLGTDFSTALLEFSSNYRSNLKQRAEAQANRASFWMLFPTVLCLWMSAAIVLIGPVFLEFMVRRNEAQEMLGETRQNLLNLNSENPAAQNGNAPTLP